MAVKKNLSVISCQNCGYVNMINPRHTRDKRCRHCGAVVFSGGETVGSLVAVERARPNYVNDASKNRDKR